VTFDHIWPSYVNYISLRRFINQNIVNNKRNIDKAINCKFIQNNHTNKLIIKINQMFILNRIKCNFCSSIFSIMWF